MADQRKCPKCQTGNLFVTAEDDQHEHVHCFNCDYHMSQPKEGFEVREPGTPIVPVEKPSSAKKEG